MKLFRIRKNRVEVITWKWLWVKISSQTVLVKRFYLNGIAAKDIIIGVKITCDGCGRDLNTTLSACEIEGCEKPATKEYWNSLDDEETTKVCKEHGREAENNFVVWDLKL